MTKLKTKYDFIDSFLQCMFSYNIPMKYVYNAVYHTVDDYYLLLNKLYGAVSNDVDIFITESTLELNKEIYKISFGNSAVSTFFMTAEMKEHIMNCLELFSSLSYQDFNSYTKFFASDFLELYICKIFNCKYKSDEFNKMYEKIESYRINKKVISFVPSIYATYTIVPLVWKRK